MPDRIEKFASPDDNRMVLIDHVTGEVWLSRKVVGVEATELANVARESWVPLDSNNVEGGRRGLSVVR